MQAFENNGPPERIDSDRLWPILGASPRRRRLRRPNCFRNLSNGGSASALRQTRTPQKSPAHGGALLWNMARPRGFEPLTSASGGHQESSFRGGSDGCKSLSVSKLLMVAGSFKKPFKTATYTIYNFYGHRMSGCGWFISGILSAALRVRNLLSHSRFRYSNQENMSGFICPNMDSDCALSPSVGPRDLLGFTPFPRLSMEVTVQNARGVSSYRIPRERADTCIVRGGSDLFQCEAKLTLGFA